MSCLISEKMNGLESDKDYWRKRIEKGVRVPTKRQDAPKFVWGWHGWGFYPLEAVQQFKIGRKRKADNALNQKRRNIFGAKTNCVTVSLKIELYLERSSSLLKMDASEFIQGWCGRG